MKLILMGGLLPFSTALVSGQSSDFGDWGHATAPAGAATTTTSSTVDPNLRLGATVDAEASVTPNAAATADGADEDGATMPANLTLGASFTIPVSVFNNTGGNAYLNAWIDFNNDGIFSDTLVSSGGERLEAVRTIITSATATLQNITFTVPASASVGTQRGVRFRLSNQATTPPTGAVGAGEVEDYVATITAALSVGNLVWADVNNDGIKQSTESGISGLTVQLWSAGANGTEENGGGDDVQFGVNTTTDLNGNYLFSNLSPATGLYVRIPTPPTAFPTSSGSVVSLDNGIDNDNNGKQISSGAALRSPLFNLSPGTEPALAIDGDDTNGELTIDFGLAPADACYSSNLISNPSFEYNGVPNTNGTPVAILGYNGSGTAFGANVDALQWVGGTNGTSPINTPISNDQVLVLDTSSKVSWVESAKAHHGKRYMLFQGTNSCLNLAAAGTGAWSSVLKPGKTYQVAVWADNASATSASFQLNLEAGAKIFTVGGTDTLYYTAIQNVWMGSPKPTFLPADYNSWSEATGNPVLPNWRKYTFQFRIASTATTAQIDAASILLAGGTNTGAIAVDDIYLCEMNQGIGNLVWADANNNGLKDGTESGLANVTVQLYTSSDSVAGNGDDVLYNGINSTTTAADGSYTFAGLPNGKYVVKVTPPPGYPVTGGTPVTLDNQANNDNNGSQPGGLSTPLFSPVVTLAAGTEPTNDGDADNATDWTVDFGLWTGFTVGSMVWNDTDNSGTKNGAEVGIGGLTVELLNGGTNAVLQTTTTGADGSYTFQVYSAGSYKVRVTPSATYSLASNSVGTDNGTDNNNDGTQSGGAQGQPSTSFAFTLAINSEPGTSGSTNIENTIDFGFRTCTSFTITPTTLVNTTAGSAYGPVNFTGVGSSGYTNWTLFSGSLPNGLSLNNSTGALSGTPTAGGVGPYSFVVRCVDINGCAGLSGTLNLRVCPVFTWSTLSAPIVGSAYTGSATASGGTPSYTYAVTSGALPAWATLNASTGAITGIPNNTTTANFTITATDSLTCTGSQSYTLTPACPAITITPASLPDGDLSLGYNQTLTASGSTASYTWSISAGSLPTGLTLNSSTGVISGNSSAAVNVSFTAKATDIYGCFGIRAYTFKIVCPNPGYGYGINTTATATTPQGLYEVDIATGIARFMAAQVTGFTATDGDALAFAESLGSKGCVVYATGNANDARLAVWDRSTGVQNIAGNLATFGYTAANPIRGGAFHAGFYYCVANGTDDLWKVTITGSSGSYSITAASKVADLWNNSKAHNYGDIVIDGSGKLYGIALVSPANTPTEFFTSDLTATTPVATFISNPTNTYNGLAFGTDGKLYAGLDNAGPIHNWYEINPTTGAITTTIASGLAANLVDLTRGSCIPAALCSIGNLVWADTNNNGLKDAGESGLAGATVQLFNPGSDNAIGGTSGAADTQIGATLTTTASGAYQFGSLTPGKYFVKVTAPAGYPVTSGTVVSIDNRIDNDNNGTQAAANAPLYSPIIDLAVGGEPTTDGDSDTSSDWTVDFGLFTGFTVGNLIFADLNNNNVYDSGTDTPIGGLTVQLMSRGADNIAYTVDDAILQTTTTTAGTGLYSFTINSPGTYYVRVAPNASYPIRLAGAVSTDTGIDNDNNGINQPGLLNTVVNSAIFTLSGGTEPGSTGTTNIENTIDIGLRACPAVTISPSAVSPLTAIQDSAISTLTFTASGGGSPYNWTLASGTLPTGLTLNNAVTANTATITGTPTVVQSSSFTLRSTDAFGCSQTLNYTINVGCPTITISPSSAGPFTQYQTISNVTFTAVGGRPSYTWSATGLPTGLSLSVGGVLSGTPTGAMTSTPTQSYPVTISLTDSSGCLGSRGFTLVINCASISITTATMPNGVVDLPYGPVTLAASTTGTSVPAQTYTWSVSPSLPAGMVLNSSSGVVNGTPTVTTNTTNYTFSATNQQGCIGTRTFSISTSPSVRVGNLVWADTNNDGLKQSNESGISGIVVQLWSAGLNGIEENGAGDDQQIGSNITTDINGNYIFSPLAPANRLYVRLPTVPAVFPISGGFPVSLDNGVDNDNNGRQATSGTPVRSPLFDLTVAGEPATSVDGDDTNGDLTIDFGLSPADACYANAIVDNLSFEFNGLANTTGNPISVLGYNGSGTAFGSNVNALQWVGGVNPSTPFNQPIARQQVLIASNGAKVSWVESPKALHGKRYLLLENTLACVQLAPGNGNSAWSSVMHAGRAYEVGVWVDTASTANSSFQLDLSAGRSIIEIISGPNPGLYQYYTATQPRWAGSPSAFASTDYNGWTENTTNNTRPNWRKYTIQFRIPNTASNSDIDSLSLILSSGNNSGPIAMDFIYFCEYGLTIGDLVWDDCNHNGVKDATESGLAGATVQLFQTGADNAIGGTGVNLDVQLSTDLITDSTGAYKFSGLAPGNYYVKVTPPSTHLLTGGTPVTFDNRTDNDNNGAQASLGAPLFSPVINLLSGNESTSDGDTDANTEYTIDFGLWTGFTVGNLVWNDLNNNGLFDSSTESGVNAATVALMTRGPDNTAYNADDVLVSTTTTSAAGLFGFQVYTAGTYYLRVTPPAATLIRSSISANSDTGIDNDNNGITQPSLAGTPILSSLFTLVPGAEPGAGSAACINIETTIDTAVRACPAITINPSALPAPSQYVAYSSGTITASGAQGLTTWTLSSGTLPDGLNIVTVGPSTCAISGTAHGAPGSYSFTLQASDAYGCKGTRGYTLPLNCPTMTIGLGGPLDTITWNAGSLTKLSDVGTGVGGYALGKYRVNGTAVGGTYTADFYSVYASGWNPSVSGFAILYGLGENATGTNLDIVSPMVITGPAGYTYRSFMAGLNAYSFVTPQLDVDLNSNSGNIAFAANAQFTSVSSTRFHRSTQAPNISNEVSADVYYSSPASAFDVTLDATGYSTVNNSMNRVVVGASATPIATQGSAYTAAFNSSGGQGPYAYSVLSGTLPPGLVLNNSSPGSLTGTPTAAGSYAFTMQTTDANGCTASQGFTFVVNCPVISTSPVTGNLTAGIQDAAYTQDITASGGTAPYVWSIVTGSLPTGLALAANTSTISRIYGTPTVIGSNTFTLRTTDALGCSVDTQYTIAVGCGPITISPTALTAITQNTAMTAVTFSATGGRAPYTWSIDPATPLPAGITLSASGVLSGTATAAPNTYTFTVRVLDTNNCPGTRGMSLVINCTELSITTAAILPAGTVGTAYSQTLAVSGGNSPYVWSIVSGTWPTGLSLSSSGVVSGTPTIATTATVQVKAATSLAGGNPRLEACTYNLDLNPGDTFNIRDYIRVKGGTAGQAIDWSQVQFTYTLGGANDPVVPSNWHLAEFNAGTPVTVTSADMATGTGNSGQGEYRIYFLRNGQSSYDDKMTIRVSSSRTSLVNSAKCSPPAASFTSCSTTKDFTITTSCPAISLSPTSLPTGYVGVVYSQSITPSGGTSPYTWSYTGTMPPGLSLNTTTGLLSGTPTAVSSGSITIRATDLYGCYSERIYNPLTIKSMGIGNLVWDDCNNNGIKEAIETGLAGASLQLFSPGTDNAIGGTGTAADSQVGGTITTGATGTYQFNGIAPGNYFIKVTPPVTHPLTGGTVIVSDNRIDNDNNGAQPGGQGTAIYSPIINLADGAEPATDGDTSTETDLTIDFGLWSGFKIGNLVWNDLNNDGAYQSATETGINGITVELLTPGTDNAIGGSAANADSVAATTVTAGGGIYGFNVFSPGKYFVRVTPSATYALPSSTVSTLDNGVDGDNNGVQPGGAGTAILSPIITLTAGAEPGNTGTACSIENTIDFGLVNCPVLSMTPGSLSVATQYNSYTQNLSTSGGTGPYLWTLTSGALPAGLSLASTGASIASITGTPTSALGTYNFSVTATDSRGCFITTPYALSLQCAPLAIDQTSLPVATQLTSYSTTLTATLSGTNVPAQTYTWALASGTFPAGLSLGGSTGIISGTPNSTATLGDYPITIRATNSQGCTTTKGFILTVVCPAITVTAPPNLTAIVSSPYDSGLPAASGGTATYVWRVSSGVLPAGLVLNASTGRITGTPTTIGSVSFTIEAKDASLCIGTRLLAILVDCPPMSIDPPNPLPDGQQNVAYSQQLFAVGGTSPYTWNIFSGNLPTGMTLGSSTGLLSGTPTSTPGGYSFTARAVDAKGCQILMPYDLAIGCPVLSLSPASPLPTGTVGTAYSTILTASGGVGPYIISINTGTLPLGLSIATTTANTATISGTPTSATSASLTLKITDANGCVTAKAYTLPIVCPSITITTGSPLANAEQQAAYVPVNFAATGGNTPYTWAVTSGTLPTGMSLSTAGVFSGTPTSAMGAYNFTVEATDKYNCKATKAMQITITCPTLAIAPATLPTATQYAVYSQTLTATKGNGSYSWSLFSGALPAGLSLTTGGIITGTTTAAPGNYNFVVKVTDTNTCTGTKAYTIAVVCPLPSFTTSGSLYALIGQAYSLTLTASGGTAPYTFVPVGALPGGLSVTSSTSTSITISGSPTAPQGTKAFTFHVQDNYGCVGADQTTTLNVAGLGIGNVIFSDTNGNKHFDGSEGLNGVVVKLFAAGDNPLSATALATQTTASGGKYLFLGLAPGNYFIHVPASEFAIGKPLYNKVSVSGSGFGDGVDDAADENSIDVANPFATGVSSGSVALAYGAEVTDAGSEVGYAASDDNALPFYAAGTSDANVDLTVDLGFTDLCAASGGTGTLGNIALLAASPQLSWSNTTGKLTGSLALGGAQVTVQAPNTTYAVGSVVPTTFVFSADANGSMNTIGGLPAQPLSNISFTLRDAANAIVIAGTATAGNLVGLTTSTASVTFSAYASTGFSGDGLVLTSDIFGIAVPNASATITLNLSQTPTPLQASANGKLRDTTFASTTGNYSATYYTINGGLTNASLEDNTGTGFPSGGTFAGGASNNLSSARPQGTNAYGSDTLKTDRWIKSTAAQHGEEYIYLSGASQGAEIAITDALEVTPLTGLNVLGSKCYQLCVYAASASTSVKSNRIAINLYQGLADGTWFMSTRQFTLPANAAWSDTALSTIPWAQYCFSLKTEPTATKIRAIIAAEADSGGTESSVVIDNVCFADCPTSTPYVGIGNLVYNDTNYSGTANPGEGVNNVWAYLYAAGAVPGTDLPLAGTATHTGGRYTFGALSAASYFVRISPRNFQTSNALFGLKSAPSNSGDDAVDDGIVGNDNGIDNSTPATNGIQSPLISLTDNGEPTDGTTELGIDQTLDNDDDNNSDLTIDFAFVKPYTVGNLVWNDLNNNGLFDSGTESGINGQVVNFLTLGSDNAIGGTGTSADSIAQATTTTSGGLYSFEVFAPGTYAISLTPSATQITSWNVVTTDNGIDNDNNGSQPGGVGTVVTSMPFVLALNTEPGSSGNANTENTIDFGLLSCPPLTIAPSPGPGLNTPVQGNAFTQAFSATGGTGAITWRISTGVLPAGLTINGSSGTISGTPTTIESRTFTIEAKDSKNCLGTQSVTLSVNCAPLVFAPATLPNATQYQSYNQPITVTGGTPAYTLSLANGSSLPPGLSLTSGAITGTPNIPSGTALPLSHSFTLNVVDAASCVGSKGYTLVVNCPATSITTANIANGTVGSAYSQALTASTTGATGLAYTWAVTSGTLPAGLTLNSSSGVISGTPTAATVVPSITFSATDGNGCVATRAYTNWSMNCPTITITAPTAPLGNATQYGTYPTSFSASGGTAPYTYAISSGSLPTGLSLSSAGLVSGTITGAPGTYSFSVRATDNYNCISAPVNYSLTVVCPAITLNPTSIPAGIVGSPYSSTSITASGGTAPYAYVITSGTLPAGMTFTSGVLAGSPQVAVTNLALTIEASDANLCKGNRTYSLTTTCPSLSITPTTVPDAPVGAAYSQAFTATGGSAPYTWTLVSGALPSGLSFNTSTGTLEGTPTVAATAIPFTIRATDKWGCQITSSGLTITTRSLGIGGIVWVDTNPNGLYNGSSVESGIAALTLQLWSVGTNGNVDNAAGDDLVVSTQATDSTGTYLFSNVPPGGYYVRIATPSVYFPTVVTPIVSLDNGTKNDNNGSQPSGSGTAVLSPKITLAMGAEPAAGIDANGTDIDSTIDIGFVENDPCYRTGGNRIDNASFELAGTNPAAPNGGTPLAVLGYTGTGTSFGNNVNAYQWLGGTNGNSLLNQPITRAIVNVGTTGSKLNWVESTKGRHGKRYLLLEGSDSNLELRAAGGGSWSSQLTAGSEYELAIYADTASAANAAMTLKLSATSSLFQIISGASPGFYDNYTVAQSEFVGPLTTFTSADYNGWSEANATAPNWRQFTYRFRIRSNATASEINAASLSLCTATNSGLIALDYAYLCIRTSNPTLALCGNVWIDTDNDGSKETGEARLAVAVTLKSAGPDNIPFNSDDVTVAGPTNTSVSGLYAFNNLPPGNYYVSLNPGAGYLTSGTPVDADNGIDNDNNGVQVGGVGGSIHSPLVNLTYGDEPTNDGDGNPDTDCTIDIGVWPGFLIGNKVWNDTNNNGLKDSSEAQLPSVPVALYKAGPDNLAGTADDIIVSNTLTSTSGSPTYGFAVYEAGNYFVQVTPPLAYPIASRVVFSSDNGVNNDNNGSQPGLAGTAINSMVFSLTAGKEPGTNGTGNTENSIDFGVLACPTITVSPSTIGSATQFAAYTQTLTASGGFGNYVWSLSAGALPTGITLNSSTGVISGTTSLPPGNYNITVQARDDAGCTGTRAYTLAVICPPITIAQSTLPTATQFSTYSTTLTASTAGTTGVSYTWSIDSGSLPPGLNLNSSTGLVSGSPNASSAPGNITFTARATDTNGCFATKLITLPVICSAVAISGTTPDGTQYSTYTTTLTAGGAVAPYSWSLQAGALPAGLSLSSASTTTAIISGTPSEVASRAFTIRATDKNGCYLDKTFTINISCPPLTITPASLSSLVQYMPMTSITFIANGGTAPYTPWSINSSSPLPEGLTLSTSGVLSGIPTAAPGTYNVTVQTWDSSGCYGSRGIAITIVCPVVSLALTGASEDIIWNAGTLTKIADIGTPITTVGLGHFTVNGSTPSGKAYTADFYSHTGGGYNPNVYNSTSITLYSGNVANGTNLDIVSPFSVTGPASCDYRSFGGYMNANSFSNPQLDNDIISNSGNLSVNNLTGIEMLAANKFDRKNTVANTSDNQGVTATFITPASSFNLTLDSTGYTSLYNSLGAITVGNTSAPTSIIVGTPYSAAILASGGQAPYNYTVTSGGLPPGLSLSSTTGDLTGTPSLAGTYTFTVTAKDVNNCNTAQAFTLSPLCPTVGITTATTLPTATQYASGYNQSLAAIGGSSPYTWIITSGSLPSGLNLSSAGVISGTTSAAPGNYNFTVKATDLYGCYTTKALTLPLVCSPIAISPSSPLPTASQYVAGYSQTLTASGATAPYTWIVKTGTLPAGLVLTQTSNTTTTISGTVTAPAGNYGFTIEATDTYGCKGTLSYNLPVISIDYGDNSLLATANCITSTTIKLGTGITDGDTSTQGNATATADDLAGSDDEDGVTFGTFTTGLTGTLNIRVTNTSGAPAYLTGWIDYNNDHALQVSEQITASPSTIATGTVNALQTITVSVPANATIGDVAVRLRFSSVSGNAPFGANGEGEVEDHLVHICAPQPCAPTLVSQN